ncbi:MAG: hypothetical protein GC193_14970 [Cryomorphaceae bacterium]|nr:hypothetical protein [Cryomorphaceae bacterium]
MLIPSILGGLASVGIGFFLKKAYENDYRYQITDREFLVTAAVVFFVASPVTAWVGYNMAIQANVTYQETWSGWELRAVKDITECTRDGFCHYEYDCDPYTVTVERDGKEVEETRYHQCPYLSQEWSFTLSTTAGDVLIASHQAPPNPQNYRYRAWVPVPSHIPSGIPDSWTEARQRIEAGTPCLASN